MATKKTATKKAPEEKAPKKLGRPAEVLKLTVGEAPPDIADFATRLVAQTGDDGKLLVAMMRYFRQQERVVGPHGVVMLLKQYGA